MDYRGEEVTRNVVDWEAPALRTLLQKTDGWQLDNRATREPLACELHVGWGVGSGKRAALVYERDRVMVVETTWIVPAGENVRIDFVQGSVPRSRWGVVAEVKAGRRAEDLAEGIHVYWIHRT